MAITQVWYVFQRVCQFFTAVGAALVAMGCVLKDGEGLIVVGLFIFVGFLTPYLLGRLFGWWMWG